MEDWFGVDDEGGDVSDGFVLFDNGGGVTFGLELEVGVAELDDRCGDVADWGGLDESAAAGGGADDVDVVDEDGVVTLGS